MSRKLLPVLSSAEWITSRSRDVMIPKNGIQKAATFISSQMEKSQYSRKNWRLHELNPKEDWGDRQTVAWIFLVDLLNFSFWSENETINSEKVFAIRYRDKTWTGYWSLCAAINRALDEGIPITDAAFFANIDRKQVEHIFRPDNSGETTRELIPLLDERVRVLQEAGSILVRVRENSALKSRRCISFVEI